MSHRIEKNDKQQGLKMAWHKLTEIVANLTLDNCWLNTWDIVPRVLHLPTIAPASTPALQDGADHLAIIGGELPECQCDGPECDCGVPTVLPATLLLPTDYVPTEWALLGATDSPHITIGKPYNPNSYRPITNREFLQLLRDSTEGIDNCKLVSIGSIRNRGRVFASFETEELGMYRAGGRDWKPYVNYGNGHDQSSVLWSNNGNHCVVCDNTFELSRTQLESMILDSVRAKHTKNIALRLPELGQVIREAIQLHRNFAIAFETLAETAIPFETAERVVAGFVVVDKQAETLTTRARNIIGRIMELFQTGKGNHGQNLSDLFSAVTDYYTHENAGRNADAWKQFESSEFGTGREKKASFWKLVNDGAAMEEIAKRGALLLKDRD